MNNTFTAFWVQENKDGMFTSQVRELPFSKLPENDVLIRVHYSSLNYKDALSASGNKGVTKNYPFVPGIDASGEVVEDRTSTFSKGEKVIVTGYDLGMNTFGGFGSYIRVSKDWVVPLPEKLSLKTAMIYGTAGYTAAYGILRLQRELIQPGTHPVLVTGATGGVGSMAVYQLARSGYEVIAATGKTDQEELLTALGAAQVIHRDEVYPEKQSLLNKGHYHGVIETVGGKMLEALIPQMKPDGAIACCGNILGHELHTNVYPFILRGVSLLGIDSGITKMPLRLKIWDQIAGYENNFPENYCKVIEPERLQIEIDRMLQGAQTGRVVIEHSANNRD